MVEDFVEVAGANSLFQLIDLVLIKIGIQFNQFSWLPTNIIFLYALYFSNINIWCWSINFTTVSFAFEVLTILVKNSGFCFS